MADISKITVGGTTYNVKDEEARSQIGELNENLPFPLATAGEGEDKQYGYRNDAGEFIPFGGGDMFTQEPYTGWSGGGTLPYTVTEDCDAFLLRGTGVNTDPEINIYVGSELVLKSKKSGENVRQILYQGALQAGDKGRYVGVCIRKLHAGDIISSNIASTSISFSVSLYKST